MANITLPNGPNIKFASMGFELERADIPVRRADGSTQITAYAIALWAANVRLPKLTEAELLAWSSALSQLSALENQCYLTPGDYAAPTYGGNVPRVNGASQTGLSLVCDNVTPSTLILPEGAYFDVATGTSDLELKKLTSDAISDVSGNVTLNFSAALRHSPANNVDTRIVEPRALFILRTAIASWDIDLLRYGGVSFELTEMVFPE